MSTPIASRYNAHTEDHPTAMSASTYASLCTKNANWPAKFSKRHRPTRNFRIAFGKSESGEFMGIEYNLASQTYKYASNATMLNIAWTGKRLAP